MSRWWPVEQLSDHGAHLRVGDDVVWIYVYRGKLELRIDIGVAAQ